MFLIGIVDPGDLREHFKERKELRGGLLPVIHVLWRANNCLLGVFNDRGSRTKVLFDAAVDIFCLFVHEVIGQSRNSALCIDNGYRNDDKNRKNKNESGR